MAMKFKKTLSNDEIKKLFVDYKNGNCVAREMIIEHNLRLVSYRVFDRFKSFEYDREDIMSVGIIGLIKAVDTYDVFRGMEFATYASRCIDNEILMFFRKKKVENEEFSLDTTIIETGDDNNLTFGDTIRSDEDIECEYIDRLMVINNSCVINRVLEKLDYVDRECVKLYFGFYDGIRYKQREIALRFNISRSYVSRVILRAINKMKRYVDYEDGYISIIRENSDEIKQDNTVREIIVDDMRDELEIDDLFKMFNTLMFEQLMNDVISISEINMLFNLFNIDINLGDNFSFNKIEVTSMLRKILFIYKERLNMYMDDVDKVLYEEYKFVKTKI